MSSYSKKYDVHFSVSKSKRTSLKFWELYSMNKFGRLTKLIWKNLKYNCSGDQETNSEGRINDLKAWLTGITFRIILYLIIYVLKRSCRFRHLIHLHFLTSLLSLFLLNYHQLYRLTNFSTVIRYNWPQIHVLKMMAKFQTTYQTHK